MNDLFNELFNEKFHIPISVQKAVKLHKIYQELRWKFTDIGGLFLTVSMMLRNMESVKFIKIDHEIHLNKTVALK